MKRTKKITHLHLFVSCCLLLAGCISFQRPPKDYYPVYARFRLFNSHLPLQPSSNGVIKIAAQKSNRTAVIAWHSIEIDDGKFTVFGRNGTFSLEKGNIFTLCLDDLGCFTGKMNWLGFTLNLRPYLDDESFPWFGITAFNPSLGDELRTRYPVLNNRPPDEPWQKTILQFHSVISNGWRCIKIPYSVSTNFQGDLGKLTLLSNWYE